MKPQCPPPLSQGAALSLLAGSRAGDTGRKRSARSRPSGTPGETLPGGASVLIIGPGSPVHTATVVYLTILVFLNIYSQYFLGILIISTSSEIMYEIQRICKIG